MNVVTNLAKTVALVIGATIAIAIALPSVAVRCFYLLCVDIGNIWRKP